MWLPVVGSFYLCLKIREIKQREWQQQLEPCACAQTQFIRKTQGSKPQLHSNYGKKKSTGPSELMNDDATKEIRSAGEVRNTQS